MIMICFTIFFCSVLMSCHGFIPPLSSVILTSDKNVVELDTESLTLTCKVNDPTKYNISKVIFKEGSAELPGDIDIIDETTARLTLPTISSETYKPYNYSQLSLFCFSAHHIVDIGREPLQPSITCSITNLVELNCYIAPNKNELIKHTRIGNRALLTVSPEWSHLADDQCSVDGTCLTCSNYSTGCTWNLLNYNFTLEDTLYMHAKLENVLGERSVLVPVKLIEITKLEKPNIASIDVSKTSRSLDILIPKNDLRHKDVMYIVEYRDKWDNTWTQKEFEIGANRNVSNLTLVGLTPHSIIDIKLKRKLKGSLHWSEESDILPTQTSAEAPNAFPETTIGAFHWISDEILRLYWQPLPQKDQFGDDFIYNITSQGLPFKVIVNETEDLVTANVEITQNGDGHLSLTVGNEAGVNTQQQIFFIQSPDNNLPSPKDMKIDVYNNGKTILQWNIPDEKDIVGTTIYWCKKPQRQTQNLCEGKLHWLFAPIPVNVHILELEPQVIYNIALSTDALNRSSGMTFEPCPQYEWIEREKPPELEFPKDQHDYKVVMTWRRTACRRGILIGYEITYFKTKNEQRDGDINVVKVGPDVHNLTVTNLLPKETYVFAIAAVSLSGAKKNSTNTVITVKGLTPREIAVIVIVGTVVLILFIGGVFAIHRLRKKIIAPNFIETPNPEIPMQTPVNELDTGAEGHTYQHSQKNTSDEKPEPFQRQESGLGGSISLSDHCSMSIEDDSSDTVFEESGPTKLNSITEKVIDDPDSGVASLGKASPNLHSNGTSFNSTSLEPDTDQDSRSSQIFDSINSGTDSGDSQISHIIERDEVTGYSRITELHQ